VTITFYCLVVYNCHARSWKKILATLVECDAPGQPPCLTFRVKVLRYQVSWYVVLVMCVNPRDLRFPHRPFSLGPVSILDSHTPSWRNREWERVSERESERERVREREESRFMLFSCWWKLGWNSGKHGHWLALPSWLESTPATRDIKTLYYYGREGLLLWRYYLTLACCGGGSADHCGASRHMAGV
jgi:hypothetical protein